MSNNSKVNTNNVQEREFESYRNKMLPLTLELVAQCASDGRRSRKCHVDILSPLETKLEAPPVELGEH